MLYLTSFFKSSSDSRCLKFVAVEGEETSAVTSPGASDVGILCYIILFILLNKRWRYPVPRLYSACKWGILSVVETACLIALNQKRVISSWEESYSTNTV